MPRKKSEHYVNNKELLQALIVYREKVAHAKENDLPKPRITNYLGECFLKIATHLSYKPNFVNYMFRDDMISDGIENCVQYIHNFDPEKSRNPFAYFTQIIHYAFLRRIQKEKKQLDIKTKIESWGIAQYFYILSFIPITLLTIMSLILMIEGQLFHIFGDARCQIYSLGRIDQYCMSYFSLMLGISVIAILQIYLYWHYVTSVKNRFFPSNK